jgi:transposase
MGRHLQLHSHLSVTELERRYRSAHDPNERSWWQILWLLSQGHTAVSVSAVTGYSAYWIGQIAKRYNTDGPEAMRNRRQTDSYRPPPALPPALQEELRQLLAESARRERSWTAQQVATWMSERLGRPVSYQLGWSYLVRLKQSLQSPRSRHALADAEQQVAFKKS